MEDKKAVIYGVKSGENYHYIGKTEQLNADGGVNDSMVSKQYRDDDLRNIFLENQDIDVEQLQVVDVADWYDEKLQEVVLKYGEHHPLKNAQWMLDGKRGVWDGTDGYWKGKTRDEHTLQRLSESKYKHVVQYDLNGKRMKIWKSGKDVGILVFKDYVVKNGAGYTKLYAVMNAGTLKGRMRYNSYWFREAELLQNFGVIPTKINLKKIREIELQRRRETYQRPKTYRRYTVIYCDIKGNEICRYQNIFEAGLALKLSPNTVGRICSGTRKAKNYVLKYGPKQLQALDIPKPKYKVKPVNARRPLHKLPESSKPPKSTKPLPDISFDLWDVDL